MDVCNANTSVAFVVASIHSPGSAQHAKILARFQPELPRAVVLKGVDGFNETEVIEQLLESGLQFHNLSLYVRKWGKLATFLTKYRMLRHQVEQQIAVQVTLEDDVLPEPPFRGLVQQACTEHFGFSVAHRRHARGFNRTKPVPDLIKMSTYAEVFVTSLQGARNILAKMHRYGIRKNDDQQLGDSRIMGHTFVNAHMNSNGHDKGITLARRTNRGEITSTRGMTWHEMAMLRLLTNPAARQLPQFGMPVPLPALACNYRQP
jgi:hypothetical protein